MVVGASFIVNQGGGDEQGRTPLEVMGAFVYHVDHGNFGKACGLYADDIRGTVENCSAGFVQNAAFGMIFGGADPYDGCRIVPGSQKQVDETTVTFQIETDVIPPLAVTVELQPSGRYRITKIG
jgi:hypothetical protein